MHETWRPRLIELVEAAHDARAEGLVVSSSGNISVRLDDGHFAISAARTRLGRLRLDEVVLVRIADGAHLRGELGERPGSRPSRETPMHRAVYAESPTVGAVLHCQSEAATCFAASVDPVPVLDFIPEVPVYVRRAAAVPYLAPGTDDLGRAVATAFADPDVRIVQLGNHGQVVRGDDPAQVVERATFFELACRLRLRAAGGAPPLRIYSDAERERLAAYDRLPRGGPGRDAAAGSPTGPVVP